MADFGQVAELAERMAAEGSRLKKRAAIAAEIQAVHVEGSGDVGLFCSYLAGLPFAESDARKLNAGGALLTRALLKVSGASDAELTAAYRRHGDLGAAAYDLLREKGGEGPTHRDETAMNGAQAGLTLYEVETAFAGMATAKTTAIRAGWVEGLLTRATPLEAKYLLKLMLGDMRIGVKESLVEEAIAVAASESMSEPMSQMRDMGHPVSIAAAVSVADVRHAVMLEADLGDAAMRAFAGTLAEARMRLFHPLGFMLASPVETPEEAIERFTPKPAKGVAKMDYPASVAPAGVQAFMEDKFDGMRAQVHCGAAEEPGRVAIYSRNREDITASFPDLVEAFCAVETEDGSGLIFDGEILGWDYATGQALPFAVMGQRIGRKRVGNDIRQQVPVVFMAFDIMFADGELQLGRPLRERRNRLEQAVESHAGKVTSPLVLSEAAQKRKHAQGSMFAQDDDAERMPRLMISPSRLVENAEEIDRAYADARARANEGVMLKAADSIYQPGRRGLAWVKLKRALDTLDVVITGAEYGHGRKAQFLSDYTFAVRDADGGLKNVGKAYSGVTDAEIAELTEFLKEHTLEDHGHFRTVEPLIVLEVAFNNIMRSDRHASGFALRFPRILHIRRDKPLTEIDTVARVEEVYRSQVDKPAETAAEEEA